MYRPKKEIIITFLLGLFSGFLQAQDAEKLISQALNITNGEKISEKYVIIRDVVSKTSNVRHIYFQQALGGIPILKTESSLHFSSNGKLLKYNNNFLLKAEGMASKSLNQMLGPEEALAGIIKDMGYVSMESFSETNKSTGTPYEVHYTHQDLFEREVSLYLRYVEWEGQIVPVWKANLFEKDYIHYWDIWYHAEEGTLLKKEDLIMYCDFGNVEEDLNYNNNLYDIPNYKAPSSDDITVCESCYEVFKLPTESPLHGNRSVAEFPHNIEASPYGWHDTDGMQGPESQATNGNNVFAIEAGDHYGYQATGGNSLDFSGFPFSIEYSLENQFEDASITNAFYISNITHDILYTYGFDEASENFQINNYTGQGRGEDPLLAHVQSEVSPCSAYMVTPTDGLSPTMVVSTCNDRDGAFDNLVLVHEYTHGLTSRMTLGDGNLNYQESPTEGWSDWFGLMLTMKEEDTATTPRTIATYLRAQSTDGPGVRIYPYTTDMNENPLTFEYLEDGMSIHTVGTVWGTILWEVTWGLIDAYGFDPNIYNFTGNLDEDAGNIMALAIVIEGLRYTGADTFVEARDGIFAAARTIYGPELECVLWEAFTTRGLGFYAYSGSPYILGDEIASFDFSVLGPRFDLNLDRVCNTSNVMNFLSGGFPEGGVYSGPGVTDNGNGIYFTFDPAAAGIGEHELLYTIPESPCFPGSQKSIFVEIGEDTEPPFIDCLQDNTQTYTATSGFALPNYADEIFINDDCSDLNLARKSQTPPPGTLLKEGSVEVEIEAEDFAGNIATCSFNLTIVEMLGLGDKSFKIFPVPAVSEITLENPSELFVNQYYIWDVTGKNVQSAKLNSKSLSIQISIESLQAGVYFLSLDFKEKRETFKIIKN